MYGKDGWTVNEPVTQDKLDFLVHLRYVQRLKALSQALTVTSCLKPQLSVGGLCNLKSKLYLLEMTSKLLADEVALVSQDADYAQACVSWLPAKVYYSLYHLLSIIDYLITADKNVLRVGHSICLEGLAKHIAAGKIVFSCPFFNDVFDKGFCPAFTDT